MPDNVTEINKQEKEINKEEWRIKIQIRYYP